MADSASTNTSLYNVQDVAQTVDMLRTLGARVEYTDDVPSVDFTDHATHGAFIALGWIKVYPDGQYAVSLHDVDEEHQVAALRRVVEHFLTGSTGHMNWRRGTEADGSAITVLMAPVSVTAGIDVLERATLRDQLDRPGTCRTCDRRVRTYKLGEGGWVCGACRIEPTTFNGLAKRRLLWNRRDIANNLRQAEAAERAGDYVQAASLLNRAEQWATQRHLDWMLSIVPKELQKAERRVARRERQAAQR